MKKPEADGDTLTDLLETPGRSWSRDQRERLVKWLLQPHRHRELCLRAYAYLGDCPSPEEAEDAVSEFLTNGLNNVIANFDPAKGSFWPYLLRALRNSCAKYHKRVSRHRAPQLLEEPPSSSQDGVVWTLEPLDTSISPLEATEQKELRQAIEECLRALPCDSSEVLTKFYFQEKSIRTIAAELGLSESNVKIRLHRARPLMRGCLAAKGWIP